MEELDEVANAPAGQGVQLLAEPREKEPGPQPMHADAPDREKKPLGQGVHVLLPLRDHVPALQTVGKTDAAGLQK